MKEEEVIEYCKSHLASYKKPKTVEFMESLPRNPSGKVLKTLLREQGRDRKESTGGDLKGCYDREKKE